ncbi:MAG TPA: transcriptional regulator [Cyclobacteriaceae bacterium]|jgi:tetratricopeptide (TPR) repeat protein|nr:transcriptional regulator [Cyclobacteriaceae bacterium]
MNYLTILTRQNYLIETIHFKNVFLINQHVGRIFIFLCFITAHCSIAQTPTIDSLQSVLRKFPQDTNRVDALIELSKEQENLNADSVLNTAQKALSLALKLDYNYGKAAAYNLMAYAYHKKGRLLKASEYLLNAMSINTLMRDTTALAYNNSNIGILYASSGQKEESIKYFKQAIVYFKSISDTNGVMIAMYNLADSYSSLNNDSLALAYHNSALKISDEIEDYEVKSAILCGIGNDYYKLGRLNEALKFEEKALQLESKSDDQSVRYEIQICLAKIFLALKSPAKALKAAETGVSLAKSANDKILLVEGYKQLFQAHLTLKNFEKAFLYHVQYSNLQDSLKDADNAIAIEKLNYRSALERKESEIILLQERNEAEAFRKNVSIIFLVVVLIIGFLLYNRYRLIVEKKFQLKRKELDFYIKSLIEKSETIARINQELESTKNHPSDDITQAGKLDKILQTNILTEEDWENFKKAFQEIHPIFFSRIRYQYSEVTAAELRLSALVKLNLSLKETATILGISPESVKTARYRLRKRFQIRENETLEQFIDKLTSKEIQPKKELVN